MIAVGFDPAFIDTILTVKSADSSLLEQLPPPGHHHRNNTLTRVAGGNGVNIAYVLKELGQDIKLVVPSDDLFDTLLEKRGLQCAVRINEQVNETVAVIWAPGEIQFNAVTGRMGRSDWSELVHKSWVESSMNLSTNWGLNPASVEWMSCQFLASSGWTHEEIEQEGDLFDQALSSELQSKLVVETGSLKNHRDQGRLEQLLAHIADNTVADTYPLLLMNEEERVEFSHLTPPILIEHTAESITLHKRGGEKVFFEVPPLECTNPNFVGAGDAFFAGIVDSLERTGRVLIEPAINVAQQYICGHL